MLRSDDMAVQLASAYHLQKQTGNEPDNVFRSRVVAWLKTRGKVIEAHEAQSGSRYDNDETACGLMGLVAIALGNVNHGSTDPNHMVGDEIAAGIHLGFSPVNVQPTAYVIHDRKGDTFFLSIGDIADPNNETCLVAEYTDSRGQVAELMMDGGDGRVFLGTMYDTGLPVNAKQGSVVARFVINTDKFRPRVFRDTH